jgi:hypothetical protein
VRDGDGGGFEHHLLLDGLDRGSREKQARLQWLQGKVLCAES